MLEVVHCGQLIAVGDFDGCVYLSGVFCRCWWSPKLPQWLMRGVPLRPVVSPVWGLFCPLRAFSASSRLRLSTERRDWLREWWRPLPERRMRQGRGGGGAGLATRGPSFKAYNLGHNRDVTGHPEQHQPNLGLVLVCMSMSKVFLCVLF